VTRLARTTIRSALRGQLQLVSPLRSLAFYHAVRGPYRVRAESAATGRRQKFTALRPASASTFLEHLP
jgi:hypothetical protein